MDKRIRDRIKRIEKLEMELLSDEEILVEKKELIVLIEAMQQELLRRVVIIASLVVLVGICVIGFLSNATHLNMLTILVSVLIMIAALIQYSQKFRSLNELYKALDKLYIAD